MVRCPLVFVPLLSACLARVDVTWETPEADPICVDPLRGEGLAEPGIYTVQAQVSATRSDGAWRSVLGDRARVYDLSDPDVLLDEFELGADGVVEQDIWVVDDVAGFLLAVEGTAAFQDPRDASDGFPLSLQPVTHGDPWAGCPTWTGDDDEPLSDDAFVSAGDTVGLRFHTVSHDEDLGPMRLVVQERGGDVCGGQNLAEIQVDPVEGPNYVPWTVELGDHAPCAFEAGSEEVSFEVGTRWRGDAWREREASPLLSIGGVAPSLAP
jgi:hypothetical protein